MDQNQTLDELALTDVKPKIYSRHAIWGFSFLFSPLVGGILLSQNLKDIGNKRKANSVLITAISMTIVLLIIAYLPTRPIPLLPIIYNGAGGLLFSEFYFRKYFSSGEDYEKKKIWKPLLICFGIILAFFLAAIVIDLIQNDIV